mgnify:CR=1 FL=1
MSISLRPVSVVAATVGLVLALVGCAAGGGTGGATTATGMGTPVIAPVTMSAQDLQGTTVDLVVGQSLNITTGDLAGDSYSATVSDPRVAEFVPGGTQGSAQFNPGIRARAAGTAVVVLSNTDGGIEDVTFTVDVTTR